MNIVIDLEAVPNREMIPYLPEVKANKSLKDPVKIEADIAKKTASQVATMALPPLANNFAQIVCICTHDGSETVSFTSGDEKLLLVDFWNYMAGLSCPNFITFNGYGYDIPLLIRRSWWNNVKPSVLIDNNKYRSENHTDLFMVLNDYAPGKGGLGFYAEAKLGMELTSGADVADAWDAGDVDFIVEHCTEDVVATWKLYESMKGYYNV